MTTDYLTMDIPEIVNYNNAVINYGICCFIFEYFIPSTKFVMAEAAWETTLGTGSFSKTANFKKLYYP